MRKVVVLRYLLYYWYIRYNIVIGTCKEDENKYTNHRKLAIWHTQFLIVVKHFKTMQFIYI